MPGRRSGRLLAVNGVPAGCDGRPLWWVEDAVSDKVVAFVRFGGPIWSAYPCYFQAVVGVLAMLQAAHIQVSGWITDAWCRAAGAGLL